MPRNGWFIRENPSKIVKNLSKLRMKSDDQLFTSSISLFIRLPVDDIAKAQGGKDIDRLGGAE